MNNIPNATPNPSRVTEAEDRRDEARFFLASIVESSRDSIVTVDFDGVITTWNKAAEQVYGYSAEEAIGQQLVQLTLVQDVSEVLANIENVKHSQKVEVFESVRINKGGHEMHLEVSMSPVKDEQGKVVGVSTIARDQTAAKLLQQERERFLSVVSHEMRTPLTHIHGWISLLRSGKLQEPAVSTGLDTVQRGADTLLRLVNDLMDVERIRIGKMQLEMEPVYLLSSVANAIELVSYAADEKSINIHTKTISTDPVVLGDTARLDQVLLNLLSNAVKFTPKGGSVELCIDSHETEQGKEVELTVSDTGKGISPEFLPHVFEQFRQAEESDSRSHGGLGLGLHIARELVELHGGTIQAESDGAGKGTTFRVRLPVEPA